MLKRLYHVLWISALLSLSLNAIAQETPTLTVVTHDSFNMSTDLLADFEEENNVTVRILRAGDSGQMVNQSILSRANPLGDVLFGIDNTFLSRALDADIFEPYRAQNLDIIPEEFLLDEDYRVTPVDYGDVCLNYDIAYFEDNDIPVPTSLADLTQPEYRGLLVAMNPATSSPGLAFLLATIAEFGTEGTYTYLDYWTDLLANDTLITDGWSEAYFGYFTAGSEDGGYPLVVSYASSPPFTVDEETGLASTDSITADGMCFRQIEFVGILAGTQQPELARAFVDFMLSVPFQEDLPLQMYVFPVHPDAELPEVFAEYASLPEVPAFVSPRDIEANRDEWITTWLETVTR